MRTKGSGQKTKAILGDTILTTPTGEVIKTPFVSKADTSAVAYHILWLLHAAILGGSPSSLRFGGRSYDNPLTADFLMLPYHLPLTTYQPSRQVPLGSAAPLLCCSVAMSLCCSVAPSLCCSAALLSLFSNLYKLSFLT